MRYQKEIIEVLKKKRHMRAEEIYTTLKSQYPYMSVATVYRNVKQLANQGDVVAFLHPDGSVRYELPNESAHQHLICDNCGIIIEVSLGFIDELAGNLKEKVNFHLHTHRLMMVGRCSNCNN